MQLLEIFEVTVEGTSEDRTLLIVAGSEPEARRLARNRGRVKRVRATEGPVAVRGGSRVVGAVAPQPSI